MPAGAPYGRWEGMPPMPSHHSRERLTSSPRAVSSPGMRLPLRRLRMRCAGCTLPGSIGEPPRETGTISSLVTRHLLKTKKPTNLGRLNNRLFEIFLLAYIYGILYN